MISTEVLFLVGFVIFIAAILVLDMLVIDRKAHVVSIKEAGTWTGVWIGLALIFAVFLYFHGDMVHGIHSYQDLQAVASRYAAHLTLNPDDFESSVQQYRHYMTISYISGYLIEKTLSVDNLFVMMMIFASFGIDKKEEINAMNHPVVRFLNKHFHLSPLVLTVIFIEFCDIIFAFDSIPAVFSVTLDPYVVFFSNIFAILGLRALFFLLAAVADKFRYLKVGVSVLLVFIGAKMLIHKYVEIGAVIGISLVKKLPEKGFRYFTTAVTCISVIMLLV